MPRIGSLEHALGWFIYSAICWIQLFAIYTICTVCTFAPCACIVAPFRPIILPQPVEFNRSVSTSEIYQPPNSGIYLYYVLSINRLTSVRAIAADDMLHVTGRMTRVTGPSDLVTCWIKLRRSCLQKSVVAFASAAFPLCCCCCPCPILSLPSLLLPLTLTLLLLLPPLLRLFLHWLQFMPLMRYLRFEYVLANCCWILWNGRREISVCGLRIDSRTNPE